MNLSMLKNHKKNQKISDKAKPSMKQYMVCGWRIPPLLANHCMLIFLFFIFLLFKSNSITNIIKNLSTLVVWKIIYNHHKVTSTV